MRIVKIIFMMLFAVVLMAGCCKDEKKQTSETTKVELSDSAHKDRLLQLDHLPASCVESANELEAQMSFYTRYDIFPEPVLNCLIDTLKAHKDEGLISKIQDDDEKVMELVNRFFYCG